MNGKKRILSGIQPTGSIHFGRYFGAVRNWVELQEAYDCVFCVVDYHAMTMPWTPGKLRESSWDLAINLLATGIRPETLCIQSLIPEHAELGWILNCVTPFGQLSRMTQFKDKSAQVQEKGGDASITAALFDYPVLQAADILIYRADYVPVGKDQEQHLELTRDIALRFNNQVGKEYFALPEPLYTETPKIMSTADPARKMSASLGEKHSIDIFADDNRIRKQVRSAVTDTGEATNGEMSPGVANLFLMLRASGKSAAYDALLADYRAGTLQYVTLKDAVADALVEVSAPIKARRAELLANRKEVKNTIRDASAAIRRRAQETVRDVKELVGLQNVKRE